MTHRVLLLLSVLWLSVAVMPPKARADGMTGAATWVRSWTAAPLTADGQEQLRRTGLRIARMPAAGAATTLAARVSPEGHWTFVNMAGETFTAANAGEIKRGIDILLPDAGSRRLLMVLTADSVFERGPLLAQLPKTADLELAWGDDSYKLTAGAGAGPAARYLVELKPNLAVQLTDAGAFAEAIAQLQRPLERQAVRLLKLEPAGPRSLSSTPRVDRASGRAEIDAIDPAFLVPAIGALAGQTAVIVGRIDGGTLSIRPTSGADRALLLRPVQDAAAAGDVDLIVLKSATGQQPGGRNWLWQRIEVKGLETALGHASVADFFDALGTSSNRLVMVVERPSSSRTTMDLAPLFEAPTVASTTAKLGSVLAGAVAGLAGTVEHEGATAYFRSASRKAELERRLVPYVPSAVQLLYGGLLLLGLVGVPVSWRWWRRLWPEEKASDYPSRTGLVAARVVRAFAYGALFMPLAALVAAPAMAGALIKRAMRQVTAAPKATQ